MEVASGLRERRHDVLVVVNKDAEAFAEYLPRVHIQELHRGARFDFRLPRDIRRAIEAFRADVCVCVNFNASLWGRVAAASLGCRIVVAEHATGHTRAAEFLTNRILSGVTESVIACAEDQVDSLVRGGHRRDKIAVVRNGVDAARFTRDERAASALRRELGVPGGARVVGLVAAHRAEKRHDRFISLVERLDERGVVAWGLMAGGGPQEARTRAMARASRVAERLRVVGAREDLPAVYAAVDVVVLVSDDVETFPLCFLEAQACGVPVIGLDTGGVRETMLPGVTGFVVSQDDQDRMTSLVADLLASPDQRLRMGASGRRFVQEHLSRDKMLDGYERVLSGRLLASSCGTS